MTGDDLRQIGRPELLPFAGTESFSARDMVDGID